MKKIFGEEAISAAADSAEELAEKINEDSSIKNIVFFCGDQRRNELPDKLKNSGIGVEEVIVYKTLETPHVLTKQYDGILFSARVRFKAFFRKFPSGNNQDFRNWQNDCQCRKTFCTTTCYYC